MYQRVCFIPHDQDKEDQIAEERAERRAMQREPVEDSDDNLERFGGLDPQDYEFTDVDTFAEYLLDDERTEFTHHEMACVNTRTGIPVGQIRQTLESYGFSLKRREREQNFRGFKSNPHDRWSAYPSHGGGGGGSIVGMAD